MTMRSVGFRLVVVLAAALALAACSKKNTPNLEASGTGLDGDSTSRVGSATPGSKAEFETEIGDRIYFIVDTVTLTPEAKDTLSRQAEWLLKYRNVSVQVEGHADERGTREYNISLSARRATAARNYLLQQGVPSNRVASIAYGKERPASLCDAEECWSQNRRSVTVITGGAG